MRLVVSVMAVICLLAACAGSGSSDARPPASTDASDSFPSATSVAPTTETSRPEAVPSEPSVATTAEPSASRGEIDAGIGRGGVPIDMSIEVIREISRLPDVFTQGLEIVDGLVVESGGLYGESRVRQADPETFIETASVDLPTDVFAEGLTLVDDRLYVLTWREERVFVIEPESLAIVDELTLDAEGWGICARPDGTLATSDGSDTITIRDSALRRLDDLVVTRAGAPVARLNELECVGSTIWANVWMTEEILAIDADTGVVQAVVDAAGLLSPAPSEGDSNAVLNGIAHLDGDRFLITGKLWPSVFEVRFIPKP